ncbi:MAG: glycosyltransferase [Candidatus Saccharibacteria bacterium]|nr:glycosyltransferase [Candidatus Saccharibacteria bacterium]
MNKRSKNLFSILVFLSLMLIGVFAIWWFNPSHIPANFSGYFHLFDLLLFICISYVIWHPIVMQVFSWAITSNIKERAYIKPQKGYKVAFITNFVPASESIELLHKTLPAMVRANYAHDTWLLDEGDDPEVKKLCEKLGVLHFSRFGKENYNTQGGKFAIKTKGGNHNAWYDSFGDSYDFVAQIDTDFIPKKNFLIKTLGYFRDSNVAFVGTPQIYGNIDESLISRGAAQQTYNFYGNILRGFDGMNMNMLIGANHVIRVGALKDVDHYSAHITEDLLTGMKLHSKGWKSVYVPEALAVGEGPTSWQAYFNQQMRWAYGCIHILFNHSPGLFKKMDRRQKIYYFFLQQHYFSGFAMSLGVLGLGIYFILGVNAADMSLAPFLSFYLPALIACGLMALWIQRFNVRPKEESGMLWAGKIISIASWPIFFLAFFSVLRGKRLTYKVTPKGEGQDIELSKSRTMKLFNIHLVIGLICLLSLLTSLITGRSSIIMVFWATCTTLLMFFVPISEPIIRVTTQLYDVIRTNILIINSRYRIFEFRTEINNLVPSRVSNLEKYMYSKRNYLILLIFSFISFSTATFSMFRFLKANPLLWPMYILLIFSISYYIVSIAVNLFTRNFDTDKHNLLVSKWKPPDPPNVDIFLPIAGEQIHVLKNTWNGVIELIHHYKGHIKVYCLDDSNSEEIKSAANLYGFNYVVRPNRGEFKKAGNLRHGYKISKGEFIAIFDADFRPRKDFLNELLPYMYNQIDIGIVQSPQYFDVSPSQNWLERGAGAVQELFYRFSQVSRQNHQAAICVGSNALYRRKALESTGGTALIEHSEDVHTGFNLKMHGWNVKYIPIILAKGLCPESMPAFFKQQYRWCMGSMSLLRSSKFWQTKLPVRTRLSYISGFLYYINTAILSIITPFIPLILLAFMPEKIEIKYTFLVLPSLLFAYIIFPLWHKSIYGLESWSVRQVYGWAHLFAISDAISNRSMQWTPTGVVKGNDFRYKSFRILQVVFNFIPSVLWVGLSIWHLFKSESFAYVPILISGILYLLISMKVTFYTSRAPILTKNETFPVVNLGIVNSPTK